MRNIIMVLVMFIAAISGGCAVGQPKEVADIMQEDCKAEIDSFCKDVTPGKCHMLACLYAHEDKLSNPCKCTLYDAVAQFHRQ